MEAAIAGLPAESLLITWDQGKELSAHHEFSIDTGIAVYFCDPHSPWQRGSIESTNGLLRQYMEGDDYVELGIRAMEEASVPPVVVNWAGSETVSAEDYCAFMGELIGVDPIFEYDASAHTPLWPDVTRMHEVLGRTKVHWRDGFRRMIEARHPEISLQDGG